VLFLTAGSGITPVMSMLRTLVRRDQITDVIHLHSAPTAADVMFGAELERLVRDHPGYRLRVRATRDQGRLDLSQLDTEVPDWRDRQTWACGPEAISGGRGRRLFTGLVCSRFSSSRIWSQTFTHSLQI
jgi:ferredoxin-NADP reductase